MILDWHNEAAATFVGCIVISSKRPTVASQGKLLQLYHLQPTTPTNRPNHLRATHHPVAHHPVVHHHHPEVLHHHFSTVNFNYRSIV